MSARLHTRWLTAVTCSVVLLVAATSCQSERPGDAGVTRGPVLASPGPHAGLVFLGDFGNASVQEAQVSSAIRTWVGDHPFDALVTLGDNVYADGSPSEFDHAWNEPYGWVANTGVPVIASLGNHDVHTDNGAPVMDLFDMPNRWYERRVGPVDIFVLDSNDLPQGQMQWLSTALASSSAPWKVLVFHYPFYSCGPHGSTPRMQRQLMPLLARQSVDLVVNGHDHDYQRFPPTNGTTYVVSGGGGAGLYAVGDCPAGTPTPVAWNDDVHEFLYVSATSTELIGTAVSANGTVLDTFDLNK